MEENRKMTNRKKKDKNKRKFVPPGTFSRAEMLFSEPVELEHIDLALSHLSHRKKKKSKTAKDPCVTQDRYCWAKKTLSNFDMRAQIPVQHSNYLAEQMRKALLMQDWQSAARLLNSVIVTAGSRNFSALIVKACLVLLMNHPEATPSFFKEYIRNITKYGKEEEIDRMAMILCSIRDRLPPKADCEEYRKVWTKHMSRVYDGLLINNQKFTHLPLKIISP